MVCCRNFKVFGVYPADFEEEKPFPVTTNEKRQLSTSQPAKLKKTENQKSLVKTRQKITKNLPKGIHAAVHIPT